MKPGNHIRRAVLFGIICLAGYIGSINSTVAADAEEKVSTPAIKEEISALYPVRVQTEAGTRYGYINEAGQVVIQPAYLNAGNFSEGFAVVNNGEKSQLINLKGKVIFESEGTIEDFHNGLAAFYDPEKDYKHGYVNSTGKIVIKPQYEFAGDFHTDHTAFVKKSGKIYSIDNKGKVLKTYQLSDKYNYGSLTDDGYLIYTDAKTYLQGVVSLSGKGILKAAYGEITYLGSGLFGVKAAPKDAEAYLLSIKPAAIFNQSGKRLTSYSYYDLSTFDGNYASATDSKYTYLIDKNGKKASKLPEFEGRGTARVLGDVIQADIDSEMIYVKKDGTPIWKNDGITRLSSGITVNTVKVRPNKFVVVNYPQLEGLNDLDVQNAINKNLKSVFTKSRADLKQSDYLMVDDEFTVCQMKDLLIIHKTGYDYPVGAAHGMPLSFYYFINVNTGDFYQLGDLFEDNSDYTSVLGKLVNAQMKKNNKNGDMVYFDDRSDLVASDQYFYISQDKLTIYFDCGSIAAYAAGFPEFEIPFKDIMDILYTDGAFWKSFH